MLDSIQTSGLSRVDFASQLNLNLDRFTARDPVCRRWPGEPDAAGRSRSRMTEAEHPRRDEPTALLLDRMRSGDETARERLMERFLPLLQRWARGRLPAHARSSAETDDLVQVTLIRALKHVDRFESRGEGAFLAYLRRILINAIRDEIRSAGRRPAHDAVDYELPDHAPSAVEKAIGREAMQRYEQALAALKEHEREAVLLRLEFGYSYAQVAEAIGRPSANAARMVISRALVRMAQRMEA